MEKFITGQIKMKSGDIIEFELYPSIAPVTVDNFVKLCKSKFYDGLTFHRVIPGFVIQGGCPYGNGTGGPGWTIKGEFNTNGVNNPIKHELGVLSMARSGHPDSAGSQFFIMVGDSPWLDGQYAAFGSVVNGMDVVDIVATVSTDSADKPFIDQVLNSIRFVKEYEVSE